MTKAIGKMYGFSAFKARRIADLIRGQDIESVEGILKTSTSPIAGKMLKLVLSAVSNAEHNDSLSRDNLVLSRIEVDQQTTLKRYKPRSRGQAGAFNRPTSRVLVEVKEEA